LLLAGGAAYSRAPFGRLRRRAPALRGGDLARAAAYIPLIRLVGDLAKLAGYPFGRLRRRSPAIRRAVAEYRGLE
jgi:hypothetical protein